MENGIMTHSYIDSDGKEGRYDSFPSSRSSCMIAMLQTQKRVMFQVQLLEALQGNQDICLTDKMKTRRDAKFV